MRNLTILIAILLFASCEKKHCWQCVDTVRTQDSLLSTNNSELCDKTEKEIREIERSKGSSRTVAGVTWNKACTKK